MNHMNTSLLGEESRGEEKKHTALKMKKKMAELTLLIFKVDNL